MADGSTFVMAAATIPPVRVNVAADAPTFVTAVYPPVRSNVTLTGLDRWEPLSLRQPLPFHRFGSVKQLLRGPLLHDVQRKK